MPNPSPPRRDTFAELIEIAERRKKSALRAVDVQDVPAIHLDVQPRSDVQMDSLDVQASLDVQQLDVQDVHSRKRRPKSREGKALLTSRQPVQLLESFDFWCHKRRVDKQLVLGLAIQAILDGRLNLDIQDSQSARGHPNALLMIDDEKGLDIINHYSLWTSNEPRQSDMEALEELRQLPIESVKCGILMSVLRAKGRINSLKYCVGAAKEAANTPDLNTPEYLRYLEQKARRRK